MSKTIFIDLDGVLADFSGGVCKLFRKELPTDKIGSKIHEAIGIPSGLMWGTIQKSGRTFWENLEATPYANEIVCLAREHGEIFIATSPSMDPNSAAAKVAWIQKRFGRNFRNYFISPKKYLLAAPNRFLIDDSEKHVTPFKENGGDAYLFPSFENGLLTPDADPIGELEKALKR